jgi:hypothetical protein
MNALPHGVSRVLERCLQEGAYEAALRVAILAGDVQLSLHLGHPRRIQTRSQQSIGSNGVCSGNDDDISPDEDEQKQQPRHRPRFERHHVRSKCKSLKGLSPRVVTLTDPPGLNTFTPFPLGRLSPTQVQATRKCGDGSTMSLDTVRRPSGRYPCA